MGKRIAAKFYTMGKFGRKERRVLDEDNPFLYSQGRYPTKITREDLPEDFIEICGPVTWYMTGYLKTSGIVDLAYTWGKFNHLFKDDFLFLSYSEKFRTEVSQWSYEDYINSDYDNFDFLISGNDIPKLVLAAEKYSGIDTTAIRAEIEKKRIWLRDNKPDDYKILVGEDKEIFELWTEKGRFDPKLLER